MDSTDSADGIQVATGTTAPCTPPNGHIGLLSFRLRTVKLSFQLGWSDTHRALGHPLHFAPVESSSPPTVVVVVVVVVQLVQGVVT